MQAHLRMHIDMYSYMYEDLLLSHYEHSLNNTCLLSIFSDPMPMLVQEFPYTVTNTRLLLLTNNHLRSQRQDVAPRTGLYDF